MRRPVSLSPHLSSSKGQTYREVGTQSYGPAGLTPQFHEPQVAGLPKGLGGECLSIPGVPSAPTDAALSVTRNHRSRIDDRRTPRFYRCNFLPKASPDSTSPSSPWPDRVYGPALVREMPTVPIPVVTHFTILTLGPALRGHNTPVTEPVWPSKFAALVGVSRNVSCAWELGCTATNPAPVAGCRSFARPVRDAAGNPSTGPANPVSPAGVVGVLIRPILRETRPSAAFSATCGGCCSEVEPAVEPGALPTGEVISLVPTRLIA